MVKMKYCNGCSLIDFLSFSLQTEVQKLMAKARFGEHRPENRMTSSGWWTCAPFRPENLVIALNVLSVKLKILQLKNRR